MAKINVSEISSLIKEQIKSFGKEIKTETVGTVIKVGDGIALIYGLDNAMQSELLEFPHDVYGMVLNLEADNVGAILLGDADKIKEGDTVKCTGRILEVPVGDAFLGRVVCSSRGLCMLQMCAEQSGRVRESFSELLKRKIVKPPVISRMG